jgi:hypothetical protein
LTVRFGITGHSTLTPDTAPIVAEVPSGVSPPLVGVSCLARGADQLFARVVVELGGQLEVVLPAGDYRARKVERDNAAEFTDLIGKTGKVTTLPFAQSNRDAYLAASEHVLTSVDSMVAGWDGQPSEGHATDRGVASGCCPRLGVSVAGRPNGRHPVRFPPGGMSSMVRVPEPDVSVLVVGVPTVVPVPDMVAVSRASRGQRVPD